MVAAIVTPLTRPKTDDQLTGLVYGLSDTTLADDSLAGDAAWYRSPVLLGVVAVVLAALFYIPVF